MIVKWKSEASLTNLTGSIQYDRRTKQNVKGKRKKEKKGNIQGILNTPTIKKEKETTKKLSIKTNQKWALMGCTW